ncbi:MAG: histone deacetylase [bacterium]|nr:histone deacetylase [bacterium]
MPRFAILYDPAVLKHVPPVHHCEHPRRVETIITRLRYCLPEHLFLRPRPATLEEICLVHEKAYVKLILESAGKLEFLDADTYLSPGTPEAALTAAGAAITGAELLMKGELRWFYAPVRPPGHHAGRNGRALGAPSQGFCIFNNAALAAVKACQLGAKRVAILDIDGHHGNGTQEIFYDQPLLYISLHQDPHTLYPGTGFLHEVGTGEGEGFNVNLPLPPGSADDVYSEAFRQVVLPILEEYRPEILLVSLGFDAHFLDPLTYLQVSLNTYYNVYMIIKELHVPTGFLLEGGYEEKVLAQGSELPTDVFLGREEHTIIEQETESSETVFIKAVSLLREARRVLRKYWQL